MKDNDETSVAVEPITLGEIAAVLSDEERAQLLARYDIKNFARVFEDGEICATCLTFFKCRLNVSETARIMFMHRNTLIYRLDKVRQITGLDLREFSSAVTFELLYNIYFEKRTAK